MTREQMIAQILIAIQQDVNLLKVLKLAVANNIQNLTDERLAVILEALNGQN